MSIAVETLPVSETPAPVVTEPEKVSETVLPKTESPDDWFKIDQFTGGWDVNHVTAPTVFHRKSYTFADGKAYIKYSTINKLVKNLDDVILYDTRSCVYRISTDRYIIVVGTKDELINAVAVVGELSSRYLTRNDFNQYNAAIKKASEFKIVSLKQCEYLLEGGLERHLDATRGRLDGMWDAYRADIDKLFERH